ncbi:MAG TPA: ABC transporter substrate-binding protein [Nocardioidaceae bacterium]|nr:ABC transporter substrate-binding protein [Nocardioidaceae bacterium]
MGAGIAASGAAAGCSAGGGSGGSDTITVTYQQFGDSHVQANFLKSVKAQFEKAHKGVTVDLEPISASEDDYYTKLQLQMRSTRTSPDLVYEDTFLINSDIKAGYLRPLDEHLKSWSDWSQFQPTAKKAAQALNGKTYGVPDGTDVRGLWYNKELFAKAGLPTDWQPHSWDDILAAARAIKAKLPGVIPINIYSGTGVGEAATMQGFEMLLYGTGDTLYDSQQKKWVVGSKGFVDSLSFLKTLNAEHLTPPASDQLKPTWGNTVSQQLLPKGKLAIDLDGSWLSLNWQKGGAAPWPQWSSTMGTTPMPTQDGSGAGKVSLSGGWTWAIPAKSDNPGKAWDLIKLLGDRQHELEWAIKDVQIPVRKDVAADPSYAQANPTNKFFASLVPITQYRPAYAVYPRISQKIQSATESIVTGSATPQQAAKTYDQQVQGITSDVVDASAS